MSEHVVPVMEAVVWEPNSPEAVFVQNDRGRACLALNAHPADDDQRAVVLEWTGSQRAAFGGPNDEAAAHHRLYNLGFGELLWLGQVVDSTWITETASMSARAAQRHYIVKTKEVTVEVVADDLTVARVEGPTSVAASGSCGSP